MLDAFCFIHLGFRLYWGPSSSFAIKYSWVEAASNRIIFEWDTHAHNKRMNKRACTIQSNIVCIRRVYALNSRITAKIIVECIHYDGQKIDPSSKQTSRHKTKYCTWFGKSFISAQATFGNDKWMRWKKKGQHQTAVLNLVSIEIERLNQFWSPNGGHFLCTSPYGFNDHYNQMPSVSMHCIWVFFKREIDVAK